MNKLNYDYLLIDDKYYGGNQEWYSNIFHKKAGCGPTTASTITMYESKNKYSKEEFIKLMDNMWNYITPGMMGLNKIEYFDEGYNKYIKDNKLNLKETNILNISKSKDERPNIEELYEFLNNSIKLDHPVAFLNLDNGKETKLDAWHWVTIVGIEHDGNHLIATITDEGLLKKIDLTLWLNSTTKEGGFIYFS